jgi:hypothetical protein
MGAAGRCNCTFLPDSSSVEGGVFLLQCERLTKFVEESSLATETKPAPEGLYQAEHIGSGTFIIKKPKRNRAKLHRSRVRNRRPGMRK